MNKFLSSLLLILPVALLLFGYALLNPDIFDSSEEQSLPPNYIQNSQPSNSDEEAPTEDPTEDIVIEELGQFSVAEVIDGDTVVVGDGTEFLTVRILGIDAPETVSAPDGPECFNTEATLEADRLLAGQTVTLYSDPSQDLFDSYNRLLAYITLSDDTDFGESMIVGGYAREYTFKGRAYKKQQAYRAAEEAAQAAKIGLWDCE